MRPVLSRFALQNQKIHANPTKSCGGADKGIYSLMLMLYHVVKQAQKCRIYGQSKGIAGF